MKKIFLLSLIALSFAACKNTATSVDSAAFEKQLQEKLINAKEGDVIEIEEGNFSLSRPLILDGIKNVTIRGRGMDKTVLSFKGQKDGAEGLRITADGIKLEDFTILDAKGDCIKIQDATNVTFRRIKAGWTALHSTLNGSYGVYPVSCHNVLIEECEIFGSSDAGVYVGQSHNVIVRKNKVHDNVAGIEIENCIGAEVYDNLSENNTGGILIFDLPDLPVKNGSRCKVYNNKLLNNNTHNFGPKGTTVSEIPAGTGIIIMATNQCEVFNNEIKGHNSISAAVLCYKTIQKPYKDSLYDPYAGGISLHDNQFERGTGNLDKLQIFGQLFAAIFGDKVPDIVYDGDYSPKAVNSDGTIKEDQKICFHNNGNATFANLDITNGTKNKSSDISKYDCTISSWEAIKINQ